MSEAARLDDDRDLIVVLVTDTSLGACAEPGCYPIKAAAIEPISTMSYYLICSGLHQTRARMIDRVLFAVIGAAAGLAIGYTVYAVSSPALHFGFVDWMTDKAFGPPLDALIWLTLGIVVGMARSFLP